MKKVLLFAMGAMMSMASFAQEEDVTYYIQNAGFDEDLTFQSDGTMKDAISTTTSLSDRSWAYIAADSTVYARPKSTSSQNRPDGRKLEAVNGFKGRVEGWTLDSNAEFPKCEWTYFGTVSYDLPETAVPIADDGSTYLAVPARPTEFDGGAGFVYLRAGWTNSAAYKQVVKLPCAVYRLEYWTININPNTSAVAKDLTQIQCRKEVFKDEEGTGLQAQEWTKHEFEFTPTAEFTMQFGYEAANAGSGGQPIVALDGIKLYKIGEAEPLDILMMDVTDLSAEARDKGCDGLSGMFEDYSFFLEEEDLTQDRIEEIEAKIAVFKKAVDAIDDVRSIIAQMENIAASTNFPGKADFEAKIKEIESWLEPLMDGADYNYDGTVNRILNAVAEGRAAIKAYYLSQEASIDTPADYSFMIQHRWFINEDAEPLLQDDVWVFPKQFDAETGEERYTEGSASSPDLNSEGWTITGASGGDQRLNWQRGRSCWNAWRSNFTDMIAVGQTISNLPNGYYTVSADMITQAGYANGTQCVYAESTAERKTSTQTLTSEDWDNSVWETVSMTADDKVLVVDGKLTIGAQGMGDGNASAGWFLATNFQLFYLGEAPAEALKAAFDARVAAAKELAEGMHFAADKKALNDTIAKYEASTDYVAALAVLGAAITEADKSEAKYEEYMQEGKTLPTMANTLKSMGGDGYEYAEDIAQFAYNFSINWIASEDASYLKIDSIVNLTKNYVNDYVPAYNAAWELKFGLSGTSKTILENVIATQEKQLLAEMQQKDVVDAFVSELNAAVAVVKKQMIADDPDATDFTSFIQNPNAEAEAGWTFERGNGDKNTTSGQWFDGSNTRYFDSYHSENKTDEETGETTHVGLKDFRFSQLVNDLPNGTYTVGVYTRSSAEGAYVFVAPAADADTTFVEIPLNYYQGEETQDTLTLASDKFGPIWEEAKKAVESNEYTDEQYAIYNTNIDSEGTGLARGRGWQHQEITGIVVANHELLIGSMAGTEISKTEKVFAGDWYSVGGWTLTLTAKGDNTGWEGPVTGIETIKNETMQLDGIFTLTGVKAQKLQRGLNIVVRNGKVQKVMVK